MAPSFLDREGLLILGVAVVAIVLLLAAGYVLFNPPREDGSGILHDPEIDRGGSDTAAMGSRAPSPQRYDSTLEFRYPGEDGRTVLELLKRDHTVRLDSELMLFGSIVLAIDSFAAAPNEYWIYYRDSLRGDRSPEVCTTSTGETIRWVLKLRR